MTTTTTISEAPAEFICPISLHIMREPVSSGTGHTFERLAILEWLERGNQYCPITRKPMRLANLKANCCLKSRILAWRLSGGRDSQDEEILFDDMDDEYDGLDSPDVAWMRSKLNFRSSGDVNQDLRRLVDLYEEIVASSSDSTKKVEKANGHENSEQLQLKYRY